MACGGADARGRSDVRDVLPVRGDDQRSARRECSREAGRYEEVRVDDIGMEAACLAPGIAKESEVTALPAAARVDDGALDLVAARDQLGLEVATKSWTSSGEFWPGTSVRREGSACGAAIVTRVSSPSYPRVTCRIPRHISSVVPSPQRM
jgi:hypothetical protein